MVSSGENVYRRIQKALKQEVSDLPALPDIVERVLLVASSPDSSMRDLETVVASDPALSARILRAANSGLYAIPQKTTSITHAAAILGFRIIRSLALSVSIMESLGARSPSFEPKLFRRHSLAVGTAARALVRKRTTIDPETAFTAGLLHDIGKVLLARVAGREYGEVVRLVREGGDFQGAELATLGVSHAAVGAMMLRHWMIPEELSAAVESHHSPDAGELGRIIQHADEVALSLGYLSISQQKYTVLDTLPGRIEPAVADAVHNAVLDEDAVMAL